jgi:hypothetical protein
MNSKVFFPGPSGFSEFIVYFSNGLCFFDRKINDVRKNFLNFKKFPKHIIPFQKNLNDKHLNIIKNIL